MKQAILGTGLLLAPIAWFASLEANFALAPLACAGHGKGPLLLVSAAALGLAIAGGLLAWTQRNYHRRLAISGFIMSALFTIVIAAQAIPNLILGGCE
jgi:Na+-transporting NADH:ubiquinone oxidoreductase subunit NqrB